MRATPDTFVRAKALRRDMSLPERMLWSVLRGKSAGGLRWRKQHPMSEMTLDFYCASAKLAVEVDGEAHGRGDQPAQDVRRDAWLAGRGVRVLRVMAVDILRPGGLDDVVRGIVATALEYRPPPTATRPPPPWMGRR